MKIRNLTLVLLIFLSTQPFQGVEAMGRYEALNFVSGTDSSLELKIRKIDKELNLLKSSNMRLRVKVNKLFTSNESTGAFRIVTYDVSNGGRDFVSTQSREIIRGASGNRTLSVGAGRFTTSIKNLEFELYDTSNNLVNVYSATITATNLGFQTSSGTGTSTATTCLNSADPVDCILAEFFNRVNFNARRQRHPTTRVIKDSNGLYQVTLPVPRQAFAFLEGNRNRATKTATVTSNGGTTATIADVVDSLGIGVSAPVSAFLHVRNGDGFAPSLILEPGPLASNNSPGSIEFDGTNLHLTQSDGTRVTIGERGPAGQNGINGSNGAKGDKGDQGEQGPPGTLTSNNGGTFDGDVDINGNLDVSGTITAGLINAPTPAKVGADFDINGQTMIDVTDINYIKLTDSNTATVDEIFTLSGGSTGQKVILHAQNDMKIRADNAGTANSIQWGRGTTAGSSRPIDATEMYEFVFDGNAWFLIARYFL